MITYYVLSILLHTIKDIKPKNTKFFFLRISFSATVLYTVSLAPCSLIFTKYFETNLIIYTLLIIKAFLKMAYFKNSTSFRFLPQLM